MRVKILKKIRYVSGIASLVVIFLPFITFAIGGGGVVDSLLIAVLISLPVIILYGLVFGTRLKTGNVRESLGYSLVFGALAFTLVFNFSLNAVMALDTLIKGSLGPAQGYWLLISIGGSLQACFYGAIVFGVVHFFAKRFVGKS
jgi:hypothetical protein